MTESIIQFVQIAAAIGAAASGGIFLIFSNTVMRAFREAGPDAGISSMRAINRIIQNPLFFLVFFGPGLAAIVLLVLVFSGYPGIGTLSIAGSAIYLVGCIAVTVVFNVPMNNRLEALQPLQQGSEKDLNAGESYPEEARGYWETYLSVWTFWNSVRTAACFVSAVLFTMTL